MNRLRLAAALVIASTLPLSAALAQELPKPAYPAHYVRPEDRNAALAYWAAIQAMGPELPTKVREIDWEALGATIDPAQMPPAYKAVIELNLTDAVAEQFVRAARMRKVNWEIAYDEGLSALLPHLGSMRAGARFMRFAARQAMVDGRPDLAVERLTAMLGMARHAGGDPILISGLVGQAIASTAAAEARALASTGRFTPAQRDQLVAAFRALQNDPISMKAAVEGERDIFLSWVGQTYSPAGGGRALAERIAPVTTNDPAKAAALANLSSADFLRDLARARTAFDEILAAWDKPDAQQAIEAVENRATKGEFGVIATVLLPSVSRARGAADRFRNELSSTIEALEKAPTAGR